MCLRYTLAITAYQILMLTSNISRNTGCSSCCRLQSLTLASSFGHIGLGGVSFMFLVLVGRDPSDVLDKFCALWVTEAVILLGRDSC